MSTRVTGCGSQGQVSTEWFCIRTGMRQGCTLSSLLFNIVMDFLARKVIEVCEANCVRGFKAGLRIRGQVMNPQRSCSAC